jgi:hypothetical protein
MFLQLDEATHLDVYLAALAPASRATYKLCLSHLLQYISSAFTIKKVKDGWITSGLVPFKPIVIMQRCTTWGGLTPRQAYTILSAIPSLQQIARLHGEVDDASMQAAVGASVNFTSWLALWMGRKAPGGMPLDEQVINRRRVIWLNHEAVTSARRAREAAKIEKERFRVAGIEDKKQQKLISAALASEKAQAKAEAKARKLDEATEKAKDAETKRIAKVAASATKDELRIQRELEKDRQLALKTPKPAVKRPASDAPVSSPKRAILPPKSTSRRSNIHLPARFVEN